MVKAKKWILAEKFEGEPKHSNFRLEEEELPALQDGGYFHFLSIQSLLEYKWHGIITLHPFYEAILGYRCSVTESKNPDYPVGCLVQLSCGWRSRTLVNPMKAPESLFLMKVPDLGNREPSISLGILGEPGMSAYFGFLEVCHPKEDETVLVSGAAGAVGSLVGQIAKIKGCKVIGSTGTKEKCDWLKSLGFDHVFNYKETDVDDALKQAAPDGVDCFFDNVGGEMSYKVVHHMKDFGRISFCGAISTYNHIERQPELPLPFVHILARQLKVEGFIVLRWLSRFQEGRDQMLKWLNEGKIQSKETVREGFENMPQTFLDLLKGCNIGKMIVKV